MRCPQCGREIGYWPDKDAKGKPAMKPICPRKEK